ncbi:ML domain-containing protein [Microdochium trichocladiopsis]|uniref:Phosphatidylglycerol/phosphatidylinositol transfer protein n=1 Tax=Microdochium trichocladiopsis TaxID=1682393 RepID=A0A9P9BN36_9PEZI|nr:ML domain-containing protein [Microdochium trichocladiopsis]KAH7030856.1 ML domain-containing protein [Microdochium trichocladiopsis]
MRFSTASTLIATLGLATASPSGWLSNKLSSSSNVGASDALDVPGDNPLQFCDADRSQDTVIIDNVDLAPNPPQAGTDLLIKASGTVLEPIEDGAYVELVVKYGLIRLISTTADFCEQLGNVDLECPIEKGKLEVVKSVEIPKEVPPGTYHVEAKVFNKDDTPITCLTATVKFGGRKASVEEPVEL